MRKKSPSARPATRVVTAVEFINQARARGAALREAILEAGRVRLRPIVMTTVTTVCGLTPLALGIGRGADLRAPLAIAVIGGLVVATALTLISCAGGVLRGGERPRARTREDARAARRPGRGGTPVTAAGGAGQAGMVPTPVAEVPR